MQPPHLSKVGAQIQGLGHRAVAVVARHPPMRHDVERVGLLAHVVDGLILADAHDGNHLAGSLQLFCREGVEDGRAHRTVALQKKERCEAL